MGKMFLEWNPNNCVRAVLIGAILIGYMLFLRTISHPTMPFGLAVIGLSTIILISWFPKNTHTPKDRDEVIQSRKESYGIWAGITALVVFVFGIEMILRATLGWSYFLFVPVILVGLIIILAGISEESGLELNPIRCAIWLFVLLVPGYTLVELSNHGSNIGPWEGFSVIMAIPAFSLDLYLSSRETKYLNLPENSWRHVEWTPTWWVYAIHYAIVAFTLAVIPVMSQFSMFDRSPADFFLCLGICVTIAVCSAVGHVTCLIPNEAIRQHDSRRAV